MRKLLIWDIDGTLIQGRGIGKRAMDRVFSDLYGIEEGFKNIEMAGMLDSVILKNAFEFHGLKGKNVQEFYDLYYIYLEESVRNLTYNISAPGIPSLLEEVVGKDFICNALGTGNLEKAARIKLSKDDLNKYFAVGGYGDNEMERWQVIEAAINTSKEYFETDFSNDDVFVIGDTPRDIECGKKLGTKSIAVATGMHNIEQLSECSPDFLFEDLTQPDSFFKIF